MDIENIIIKNEPEIGIDGNSNGDVFDGDHFEMIETPQMQFLDPLKRIQFLEEAGLSDDLLAIPSDDKAFSCDTCDKSFKRKSHLTRHMLLHTGQKPFACDLCDERFTRSENRARHVLQVHRGGTRYKCKMCQQEFRAWGALQEHKKSHVVERPFACGICGNRFPRKDKMEAHQLSHRPRCDETMRRYPCDVCGRKFTRKDHMQRHRIVHLGVKMFKCAHCSKRFSRRDNQVKHQTICVGRVDSHKEDGDADLRTMNKEEFIDTDYCSIAGLPTIKDEMQMAIGDAATISEGIVRTNSMLMKGMPSSRDGAVEIFLVQNRYEKRSQPKQLDGMKYFTDPIAAKMQKELTPDYTILTSPSGEQFLQCNLCVRRFRHKHHLLRHQYVHFGIKPFKCGQCDRAFTRKEHLNRHIAVHDRNVVKQIVQNHPMTPFEAQDPLAAMPDDLLDNSFYPYPCDTKEELSLDIDENSGNYVSSLLEISMTSSTPITPMSHDIKAEPDNHSSTFSWSIYNNVKAETATPHENATNNDRFPCDKCDKVFHKAYLLARHSTLHTGLKRYKCDVCQRDFSRLEHQKRHMAIHSKDRSHECELCDRKFSRSDHLLTHMKSAHASVKPYRCPELCGQRFDTFREKALHARECTHR